MNFRNILLGLILIQLGACILFSTEERISHAKKASRLRYEQRYDEAIEEYRKHIDSRLSDSRREPDENPYFYEILIGDVLLDKGEPSQALESYLSAKDHEVEIPLATDRIRRVASYYREKGQYREALELLHKYRELDEFIFDIDIDEVAKLLVRKEDSKR